LVSELEASSAAPARVESTRVRGSQRDSAKPMSNTSIQVAVPGHLRGRVMALFVLAFMGMMPISSILFGSLGQKIGPAGAVLVGALLLLAWAVVLLARPGLLRAGEGAAGTVASALGGGGGP
jgi:hypothetical protein